MPVSFWITGRPGPNQKMVRILSGSKPQWKILLAKYLLMVKSATFLLEIIYIWKEHFIIREDLWDTGYTGLRTMLQFITNWPNYSMTGRSKRKYGLNELRVLLRFQTWTLSWKVFKDIKIEESCQDNYLVCQNRILNSLIRNPYPYYL